MSIRSTSLRPNPASKTPSFAVLLPCTKNARRLDWPTKLQDTLPSSSSLVAPRWSTTFPIGLGSGVLRQTPSFGERLDLKRRRRTAADLCGEKFQILLDLAQEAAQIRFIPHVGCVARRQRRAVITEAENALPLVQECTC